MEQFLWRLNIFDLCNKWKKKYIYKYNVYYCFKLMNKIITNNINFNFYVQTFFLIGIPLTRIVFVRNFLSQIFSPGFFKRIFPGNFLDGNFSRIFFIENFFVRNFFCPEIFFVRKFFWPGIFYVEIFFCSEFFFSRIFYPEIFLMEIFFLTGNLYIFSSDTDEDNVSRFDWEFFTGIFPGFLDRKFFWPEFFGPKFLLIEIFFVRIFFVRNFFVTKFFTRIFLTGFLPKIFWTRLF